MSVVNRGRLAGLQAPKSTPRTLADVVSHLKAAVANVGRAITHCTDAGVTLAGHQLGTHLGNLQQAALAISSHTDAMERAEKARTTKPAGPAGLADHKLYRMADAPSRMLLEADMAEMVQAGLPARDYLDCLADYSSAADYIGTLDGTYRTRLEDAVIAKLRSSSKPVPASEPVVQMAANAPTPAPFPVHVPAAVPAPTPITVPVKVADTAIPADWSGWSKADVLALFIATFGHEPSWAGHGMSGWRRCLDAVRTGQPIPYGQRVAGTATVKPAVPAVATPVATVPAPVKPATPAPAPVVKPVASSRPADAVAKIQAALAARTLGALSAACTMVGLPVDKGSKAMESALTKWLESPLPTVAANGTVAAPKPVVLPEGPLSHRQCMELGKESVMALAAKHGVAIPDMSKQGAFAALCGSVSKATQPVNNVPTLYVGVIDANGNGEFTEATFAQLEAAYKAAVKARKS